MKTEDIKIEEIQSVEDIDLETLNGLGAEIEINGIKFSAPPTAVLSLFEIIESPFVKGFAKLEDVKLSHLNEALFLLHDKDKAVTKLFGLKRLEKIASSTPEHFEKYMGHLYYADFELAAYKFTEKLGVFNYLEAISKVQDCINSCFKAYDLIPKGEDKTSVKKKDISITNFSQGHTDL